MGDRNRTEGSPLLGDVTDNGAARVDEPNKPSGADATRAQFLRVVIPGSLIVACFGFASQFLSIGLSEIMEGSICQREYGNVTSPYADPRCKNEAVQTRLATVKGWEQTFSLLPGLLLAVPYGMVADRYGPKFVLCLIWIGDILSQIGESAVCLCPNVFHMAWIYPFSMLSAIGGGAIGYAAMSYLVAGSITSVENRSTMFFYMNAIMIAASFASGPAGYFAMEISPVFTMALGIGGLAIQLLLTLFLPSKLPGHTAPNNIDIESERTEGVVRHAMNTLKQVALMFRALFWEDLHVALLFCSIMLTTLGGWEAIIRLQYATKRYDWSWGEAGLLASVKAVANFAGVALILPAISQFLLKKGSFSAVRKDMWLLRISIVAQVFGSVLSAVAPTGKAFVAAVSIFELSKGYLPAALSVVATLVDDKHQSLVYVTSSIMQALGSIVAGPLLAETFNLGLKWGRAWYGLPFAFAGLLQLVAAVIVFASRQRKRNESHA